MIEETQSTPVSGRVIVLGCAKSKRAHVAAVIEALSAAGHLVELLSGLEQSFERLISTADRLGGRAVFLLCGCEQLSQPALEAAIRTLRSRGIGNQSILAFMHDWSAPQQILAAAHKMTRPVTQRTASPTPVPAVGGSSDSLAQSGPPTVGKMPVTSNLSGSHAVADELIVPHSPVRRFLGSKVGIASLAGVALALLALGGAVTPSEPDDGSVNLAATVAAAQTDEEPTAPPLQGSQDVDAEPPESPTPPADSQREDHVVELDDIPAPQERPLPDNDEELVYNALRDQKIRAVDILLVSPAARKRRRGRSRRIYTSWTKAKTICEELDIDGVINWRLPTIGEFRSLSKANTLGNGKYWSSTKGNTFGTDRVVWNNMRRKMGPVSQRWTGGRVVCVRFSRPSGEAAPSTAP